MKSPIMKVMVAALAVCGLALGQQVDESKPKVGVTEKLGNTLPMDLEFYDEQGYLVPLRDVIKKPTIVTFVYYRCPGICSPLLTEVAHLVDEVDLELGKDYEIFTLSFDHTEDPDLASSKKENYISSIEKAVDPNGWRFFTGDSESIVRVTDAAGFYFMNDSGTYVHAGALIFVSPEGKITRYLNGITHLPFNVKMAIIEASEGRVGPTIAKLMSFCYSYSPEGRKYALNITRIAGLGVFALVVAFVIFLTVKPKKKRIS